MITPGKLVLLTFDGKGCNFRQNLSGRFLRPGNLLGHFIRHGFPGHRHTDMRAFGKPANVKTIWIVDKEWDVARLVTAYPHKV